ncbi:MAG TPA: serine hydrolase [Hyphomonadaceae bacterium]|nr:serine hydrolase [Hyphomonadaceae bacterium]
MKRTLLAIALTLLLAAPALAQSAFPPDADMLAMIKARVDEGRAAGIVLGVMDADGKTRVVAYGDPGPGAQPLSANSVFEIGSITKTFTATILADMAAKGEVKLDAPAQTYAPPGLTLPKRGEKEITLLNLSEQNSGLPRMPSNFKPADPANPYADYTPQQLDDFLAHYTLTRDIGAEFEYSNLGVGVLGNLLANKAGKSYEALVRDRVLKPLKMDMTGVTLTPAMQKQLAKGHNPAGAVVANWDLPTLVGAGGLRSNMSDMLKYLRANLATPPKTPLERAMADAHTPRAPASPNMQIGLNWLTTTTKSGAQYTWHNGGTGGYGTFIGFDAKRHVGVVLLVNTAGGADDIAIHLLDPTVPLSPKPTPPKPRTEVAVPAEILAKYVGVYALDSAPNFKIVVTLENGALFAQATGQPKFPLFAESPTNFFLKVVDAQLAFTKAANGQPAYVVLHQGGADQKATKVG